MAKTSCPRCHADCLPTGGTHEGEAVYACSTCIIDCRYDDECKWNLIFTESTYGIYAQGGRLAVCDDPQAHA